MNEFYEDLMCPVVYRWVKNHEGVKICHNKCCTLWIDNGDIYGVIEFHDESIVELTVKDTKSHENIFYLHFQMHDFKSTMDQFNTFFNYLCLPTIKLGESIFNNVNTNKILLSCSGGLTTSYFAYSMQEIFKRQGLDIVVDAVGYMEIDKVIDDYDMVLLAPQVAYLLPQLKNKYGNKIFIIDSLDFATNDFNAIIKKAVN